MLARCALHRILDSYVQCTMSIPRANSREPPGCAIWEKGSMMFKVEDIQNYGKEQFESAVATATSLQNHLHAIATAYGDYTKKTKSFVEKLSAVKSLDKAIEAQNEYAKTTYATFVADSQKIAGLYGDLAKQAYRPVESMIAKFNPAAAH
jgi:hypothetical protein